MNNKKITALILASALTLGATQYSYAAQMKDVDIIIDNEKIEQKVKAKTVKDILEKVDFYDFNKNDDINLSLNQEVKDDMIIKINTQKEILLNGDKIKTNANTLREYFKENDIEYKSKDYLSYGIDSKLKDGLEITFQPYQEKEIVNKDSIPFESKKEYDFNLPVGKERKQKGEKGVKKIVSKAISKKGEVSVETLYEEVVKKPKDEITYIGSRYEEKEEIPFETIRQEDNTLSSGSEVVEREGNNGKKVIIYEKIDNKYNKKEEKVVREPVNKIVRVGTKQEVSEQQNTITYSNDNTSYQGDSNWAKEWIAQRESGGSYSAYNPRGGYYGRYQLNSSLIPYGASPAEQEAAADAYVSQRYGSWERAQQFWAANGWY